MMIFLQREKATSVLEPAELRIVNRIIWFGSRLKRERVRNGFDEIMREGSPRLGAGEREFARAYESARNFSDSSLPTLG